MRKSSTPQPEHCARCRYYAPRTPRGGGWCRRRPPVVTPGTAGDKCFPIVKPTDWCGSFEAES